MKHLVHMINRSTLGGIAAVTSPTVRGGLLFMAGALTRKATQR